MVVVETTTHLFLYSGGESGSGEYVIILSPSYWYPVVNKYRYIRISGHTRMATVHRTVEGATHGSCSDIGALVFSRPAFAVLV